MHTYVIGTNVIGTNVHAPPQTPPTHTRKLSRLDAMNQS